MIFTPENVIKTLKGEKTMTRRLIKQPATGEGNPGEEMLGYPNGQPAWEVLTYGAHGLYWKTKWAVGKTYAIQPGRGKPSAGRIKILRLWEDPDVRQISDEDVKAEGYESRIAYLAHWTKMHDSQVNIQYIKLHDLWMCETPKMRRDGQVLIDALNILNYLAAERPAEKYHAVAIEYEVVEG